MNYSVPVLYYHRIGSPDPVHLSTSVADFDKQMGFLIRHGVKTITIPDLIRHLRGTEPVSRPSALVTFDDGFRDNLINAGPILRKYKMTATVFAVAQMVRPEDQPPGNGSRGFNESHTAARRGDLGDFLSFSEMETMVKSEGFEIHSHTSSHDQVFCGRKVTGFFPQDDQHWGILSAYGLPLTDGIWPVFQRTAGLTGPGLFPRPELIRQEMPAFTGPSGNLRAAIGREAPPGWFHEETPEEYRKRVSADLISSREKFACLHEDGFDTVCWPWGAAHKDLEHAAARAGYQGAFITGTGANLPGGNPFSIKRFPVKKNSMARFALGFWLRSHPVLARLYESIHGYF